MNHRFGAQFRAPRRKRAYLDANVVVVFLGFVNKHGEQGQDGVRAEEGALGPDDCCREETQQNCQQPVETLPEHTLPVPLWGDDTQRHTRPCMSTHAGGTIKLTI